MMAVDKLVDSTQLDTDLTAVANAIRTKGGTSAQLVFPSGFVDAIDAIETGGGGSVPLLIDSAEITMASTANSANNVKIQLTPIVNGFVAVYIDEFPVPDASLSTALWWAYFTSSAGNAGSNSNAILRANGTIGSDGGMCSFNKTTGLLTLGGTYGNFIAGLKYNILEFELPSA